jgi:hypothetical protein
MDAQDRLPSSDIRPIQNDAAVKAAGA